MLLFARRESVLVSLIKIKVCITNCFSDFDAFSYKLSFENLSQNLFIDK
jgi:hypothetical protein